MSFIWLLSISIQLFKAVHKGHVPEMLGAIEWGVDIDFDADISVRPNECDLGFPKTFSLSESKFALNFCVLRRLFCPAVHISFQTLACIADSDSFDFC